MISFIAFGLLLINNVTGRFADFSDLPGFPMPFESTPVLPAFSQSLSPLRSIYPWQSLPNQIRGPVCGILNGIWKNFDNFQQLSAEVRQGKAWRVFRFGLCPIIEPICAQYGNKIKTFDNILALEVYNYITEKAWIIVPCPLRPICAQYSTEFRIFKSIFQMKQDSVESGKNWLIMDPCPLCVEYKNEFQVFLNSTTLETERHLTGKNWLPTSCSELVCAKYNKEYKTFKNVLQLNAENFSAGKTWRIVYKGICGAFDDAMSYAKISSTGLTPSSTHWLTPPRNPRLALPTKSLTEYTKLSTKKRQTSKYTYSSTPSTFVTPTRFPSSTTLSTTEVITATVTPYIRSTTPYLKINSTESTLGTTTFDSSYSSIPSYSTITPFPKPTSVYSEQCLQINRYQLNNQYNGPYVEGPFYYYSNVYHRPDLKSLPNFPWLFFKKERNGF